VCHPDPRFGRVEVGPTSDAEAQGDIGGVAVRIQACRDPGNGHHSFAIRLNSNDGPFADLPPAGWLLQINGASLLNRTNLHIWSHDERCLFWDHRKDLTDQRFPPSGEVRHTHMIARPAAARSAITVAAMTTRASWHGPLGDKHLPWPVGEVCPCSNCGPTRDGRPKPEVTGPGAAILSLRSRQASYRPEELADGDRVVMSGTSQATPVIAGILAILLQLRPHSTPDEARQLLQRASSIPGHSCNDYDSAWGYGCVNLQLLYEAIRSYDA
jgi:subtilisin family serine protease